MVLPCRSYRLSPNRYAPLGFGGVSAPNPLLIQPTPPHSLISNLMSLSQLLPRLVPSQWCREGPLEPQSQTVLAAPS